MKKKQNIWSYTKLCSSFELLYKTCICIIWLTAFDQTVKAKANSKICFRKLHFQRVLVLSERLESNFETTNADQAAIRPEQSTALGFARSPLASLSLWPEIMWSDYAHGSSDVFSEEFDSDGGRENQKERGRRQPVTTGTAKSLAWFVSFQMPVIS